MKKNQLYLQMCIHDLSNEKKRGKYVRDFTETFTQVSSQWQYLPHLFSSVGWRKHGIPMFFSLSLGI